MRLPRTVRFPFGYLVRVELVDTLRDADADWDQRSRVIRILRSMPAARKRYLLTHELSHAWADWQHDCLNRGIAEN